MAYYLQMERYEPIPLAGGFPISFDVEKAMSYTTGDLGEEADFMYHGGGQWPGSIELINRGQYLIQWQLSPVCEQPLDGELFQLRHYSYSISDGWQWLPLSGLSTQLYPAGSKGFAIVDHTSSEPVTIALWNMSGMALTLNNLDGEGEYLKGRLQIYGLSAEDGDLTVIEERLADLEHCCEIDLEALEKRVACLIRTNRLQDERIAELELEYADFEGEFNFLSQPSEIYEFEADSTSNAQANLSNFTQSHTVLTGVKTYCIRDSNIFHFYNGAKKTGQVKLGNQVRNYFVGNRQFAARDENGLLFYPFDRFKGSATIVGWAFLMGGGTNPTTFGLEAIYADKSGLFLLRWNNSPDIGNLEFSFHMILAP